MEASFTSRVQEAFGALEAVPHAESRGLAATAFWTVSGPQARDHAKQRKLPDDVGPSNDESEGEEDLGPDWGTEDEDEYEDRTRRNKRPVSCEQFKLGVGGEKEDPEEEFESSKRMVGMDDTLDFEEEEDEFDRVAEGIDLGGSWLHAKDMGTIDRDMVSLKEARPMVPKSESSKPSVLKKGTGKRPRSALSEDSVLALDETRHERNNDTLEPSRELDKRLSKVPRISSSMKSSSTKEEKVLEAESKPEMNLTRHVRFTVDGEEGISAEIGDLRSVQQPASEDVRAAKRDRYRTVPDHVKNPSKYTYYSLDWSDEDEDRNNREALKDLWHSRDLANHQSEADQTAEPPKSVAFIARNKPSVGKEAHDHDSDTKMVESHHQLEAHEDKRIVVQVTAHLAEEESAEGDSGHAIAASSSADSFVNKASRKYRVRNKAKFEENAMQIG